MKVKLFGICAVLALTLAVPTAAISLEPTDTTDSLVLEASSQYATIEDGKLHVNFDRLNADSVTTIDEVFTVQTTDDDVAAITLEAESEGISFYQSDYPDVAVDTDTPLILETGESQGVGMAIDSRDAEEGTLSFTIHVIYEDDDDDESEAEPPELVNVTVSDTEVTVGETITVTGVYQGSTQSMVTTATLTQDDVVVTQRRIMVFGGQTETVSFDRTMDTPGTFEVGIDGQTETVTVTEPAEPAAQAANISVTNATLDRTHVRPGEQATVAITVTNAGDATGERTLEFAVGNFVVETKTVTLEPGETREIRFEQRFERVGTYSLAVNSVDVGTVTVAEEGTVAAAIADLPNEAAPALAVPLALGAGLVAHRRRS
ncbi:DUF1102 domain-containing protein [Natronosalvus vescus]|uniref:DUF1102 domain-containing protein n=1 Tax=Natronosalvus vescus TaxID=2953881 RepID=UPI002090928A|nr:DUF1102 domain-containing protein [Natronosalvus vescus]